MYITNKRGSVRAQMKAWPSSFISYGLFLKAAGTDQGTHLLDQSYSGHLVPLSCCWQAGWLLAKSPLTRGSQGHWHLVGPAGWAETNVKE